MIGHVWMYITLIETVLHYQSTYRIRQEALEAVARLEYLLQRQHTANVNKGG